jgi:hypothetical protein
MRLLPWIVAMAMDRPYGSWESPITSQAITAGSVGISSLKVADNQNDKVYWIEMRPQEGGRHVLCQYTPTGRVDVTPPDSNVRTRVHEYGGGAVTMSSDGVYYSEFTTQQLHHYTFGSTNSVPLTPPGNVYRFADGDVTRDMLFCIREDHSHSTPKDVVNEIVAVPTTTAQSIMTVMATGNHFYDPTTPSWPTLLGIIPTCRGMPHVSRLSVYHHHWKNLRTRTRQHTRPLLEWMEIHRSCSPSGIP